MVLQALEVVEVQLVVEAEPAELVEAVEERKAS